jgi:hypothetical protein
MMLGQHLHQRREPQREEFFFTKDKEKRTADKREEG